VGLLGEDRSDYVVDLNRERPTDRRGVCTNSQVVATSLVRAAARSTNALGFLLGFSPFRTSSPYAVSSRTRADEM
jgi:hypothetical protein